MNGQHFCQNLEYLHKFALKRMYLLQNDFVLKVVIAICETIENKENKLSLTEIQFFISINPASFLICPLWLPNQLERLRNLQWIISTSFINTFEINVALALKNLCGTSKNRSFNSTWITLYSDPTDRMKIFLEEKVLWIQRWMWFDFEVSIFH